MTRRCVLVLHGVGNRGEEDSFNARVDRLQSQVGEDLHLIPVFWGDLGGVSDYVEATLPTSDGIDVRGAGDEADPADVEAAFALLDSRDSIEVRGPAAVDGTTSARFVDAVVEAWERQTGSPPPRPEIQTAVDRVWGDLSSLQRVGDEELLRDIATSVAEGVAADIQSDAIEVRGGASHPAPDVWAKEIKKTDGFFDRMVRRIGGRLNYTLRKKYAPNFISFAGDIISYLSREDLVYARIRQRIDEECAGAGTQERPIGVIAHSLGGVIAFDLAVAKDKALYIDGFVTFGSQSPFFHAVCDRSDAIDAFRGQAVRLPATFSGKWVNLWEPMDPLAFIAENTFEHPNGPDRIRDQPVKSPPGTGLWTHSSYWDIDDLARAVREVFPEA